MRLGEGYPVPASLSSAVQLVLAAGKGCEPVNGAEQVNAKQASQLQRRLNSVCSFCFQPNALFSRAGSAGVACESGYAGLLGSSQLPIFALHEEKHALSSKDHQHAGISTLKANRHSNA